MTARRVTAQIPTVTALMLHQLRQQMMRVVIQMAVVIQMVRIIRTPHRHADSTSNQPSADPTSAPSDNNNGDNNNGDDPASVAAGYIGKSMSDLESACGSPNGSDYEDEPESGKTGYYYYDTFTVSTTFDDDGNEVVSGVW